MDAQAAGAMKKAAERASPREWYGSAQRGAENVAAGPCAGFEKPGTCPLTGKPLLPANQDLASLRSLQDWYLLPAHRRPGVAEVATIGGFVKQYQVVLDPEKLQAYKLSLNDVMTAVEPRTTTSAARSSR